MAVEAPHLTILNTCRSCLRLHHSKRLRRSVSSIPTASSSRWLSGTSSRNQESDQLDTPRWQQTPRNMVMPVRSRPRPQGEFKVNNDPRRLDQSLASFFGNRRGGTAIPLSEEVKWLAITHKSFDHGRRGFNDRLAFLGKRIVDVQASLALLKAPPSSQSQESKDRHGREVFTHSDLKSLENLTVHNKATTLHKNRLANLAKKHGLAEVIRWKPKQHNDQSGSGLDTVLAQTVYSIVGALALENGGHVANAFVKQRILEPLGLSSS